MRKLLLILILAVLSIAVSGQSIWKPIPKDYFSSKDNYRALADLKVAPQAWFLRWNVGVLATSYTKNQVTDVFEPSAFGAVGVGLGYQHYRDANGEPFNDYGANILFLQNTQTKGSGIGAYVNYSIAAVGAHYDFGIGQICFDIGVTIKY